MQFGQILKNILDKNQEVWIPTIGLLGYNKATSKLALDTYGSASDSDLLSLISEIKQVSLAEAKGILIQEVEGIKSTIKNDGKFSIDSVGDISFNMGSFEFEAKKTLFPTNFFGAGNFNPAAFSNNAPPKTEEVKPIVPIINEQEFKSQLDNLIEEKTELPAEDVKEESSKSSFFIKVKEKIKSKSTKPEVSEIDFSAPELTPEPIFIEPEIMVSEPEIIVPDVVVEPEIVFEAKEEITQVEKIDEEKFEETNLEIRDNDFTPEYTTIASEEPAIIESEKKIEEIVITEPRRNIGKSRYDDGFYEYTGGFMENKSKKKWVLVGLLSIAIIGFGLLGAWFASNYFNKKKDIPAKPVIAQKIDTVVKIDTARKTDTVAKLSKKDSISIAAPVSKPNTTIANNTPSKATSTIPVSPSKQPSTQTTQSTPKNTPPKTPSADPVSKKAVAVATKSTKKIEEKNTKSIDVAPKEVKVAKVKDTTKVVKAVKVNIMGAPYATANYTKGNHYLSFGKFKIASAAAKLKRDMKLKAGVETDIILIDGSYKVVIPYISKDKAESASKDYPSTTLFE
jgi:hypothetical protein